MWSQEDSLRNIKKYIDSNYNQKKENLRLQSKKPFYNIMKAEIEREKRRFKKRCIADKKLIEVVTPPNASTVQEFLLKKFFGKWYTQNVNKINKLFK